MIEILVLENTSVVNQYKDFIDSEENADWNVGIARSIEEAIEYVKKVNLHIIIFDQRLDDGELGTDAFKQVLKISPLVQGIMLSGMATADELDKAEDLGGTCLYLNKKNVLSLPERINEAIARYYLAPRSSRRVDKVVKKFRKFPYLFSPFKLRLLSYSELEEKYVNEDDWRETIIARAGQEKTIEKTHASSREIVLNCTAKHHVGYEAGLSLEEIKSAVKQSLETELGISSYITIEDEDKETIKIQIPQIPDDPSKVYLVETRCEVAPSYKKYKVHYALECSCCNNRSYIDYECLVPNKKLCKRQVSVYSDKNKVIIPL